MAELKPASGDLLTPRLYLEAVTLARLDAQARALTSLFADVELHRYVTFEAQSPDEQRTRYERWARGISPDGTQVWLNWVAREGTTGEVVGHFQATIMSGGVANLGYMVARAWQRQGLAFEGLWAAIHCLTDFCGLDGNRVRRVQAQIDPQNAASVGLALKLGMLPSQDHDSTDLIFGLDLDPFFWSPRKQSQLNQVRPLPSP